MKNSTILRTAKVGGFNKEDVLTYVDELNSKIDSLKGELETAKSLPVDTSELENYKSEVERLKERLSETETSLSTARTDFDSQKSELENQKNIISEENEKLKNEIEALKYQLDAAQNAAPIVTSEVVKPVDTTRFENEISDLKIQLESARGQISEMSGEMTKLAYDITDKAKKIEQLNLDNEELRLQTDDSSFSGNFDMGALFVEAQATAKRIVVEARIASDKLVRDAQNEADRLITDAKTEADSINKTARTDAAIMEADAKKNAQSAVNTTEKLKEIFKTEISILENKFAEVMENVKYTANRLNKDIENARTTIVDNANDFIDGKTGLNDALNEIKFVSDNTDIPVEKSETVSYGFESVGFDTNEPESEIEPVQMSEMTYDENPYITMPEYEVDEEPYISSEDFYSVEATEDETEEVSEINNYEMKSPDSAVDDILSSFAIDPVSDDDEFLSVPKTSTPLGFDLGDLAKLAAEAEKDM